MLDRWLQRAHLRSAVLAAAIALAGCASGSSPKATSVQTGSGTSTPSTTATRTSTAVATSTQTTKAQPLTSIDGCLSQDRTTRLVHFHAPGELLPAAVIGTGAIGVVLANQTDNTVCEWLPLPSFLAAHRMRVLAFDYGNGDYSTEVRAAASYLRLMGAKPVVLIGASIGGATVIDAGVHMRPAPTAVISLSAVPDATDYPFPADARRLTSPILQVGSTLDPLTDDGQITRSLYRASPSPSKRLLLIAGTSAHGTDFASDGRVRAAILRFTAAHAPN